MPVGKPLGDTKIKIINQELLVSGSLLSKGYINQDQMTLELLATFDFNLL